MALVTRAIVGTVLLSVTLPVGAAWATAQMLTDAKKAGMPAKNCQYCHSEVMPKKGTFKPDSLNDRGKFLLNDMQTRQLKVPDMKKLNDFPGGTEQK
ncbi:MAG TPA: hypothetical protein VIG37_11880 [Methylomirabilota bacterium]|jgi:hypothetical protein